MTILLRRKVRHERLSQREGLLVAGLVVGWQVQESLVPDARAGLTPRDMVERKLLALRWREQLGFRTANAAQSEDGRSEQNGSSRPIDAEFEGRQRDKLLPLDPAESAYFSETNKNRLLALPTLEVGSSEDDDPTIPHLQPGPQ